MNWPLRQREIPPRGVPQWHSHGLLIESESSDGLVRGANGAVDSAERLGVGGLKVLGADRYEEAAHVGSAGSRQDALAGLPRPVATAGHDDHDPLPGLVAGREVHHGLLVRGGPGQCADDAPEEGLGSLRRSCADD